MTLLPILPGNVDAGLKKQTGTLAFKTLHNGIKKFYSGMKDKGKKFLQTISNGAQEAAGGHEISVKKSRNR